MAFKTLERLKNSIIVNIDNYNNDYLNDPIFIKYTIEFSEKGGAKSFLTTSIEHFNILRETTILPIFFEFKLDCTYINEILKLKPNFLVIDITSISDTSKLNSLIGKLRCDFNGAILAKVCNMHTALTAYKCNMDGIFYHVEGCNLNKTLIKDLKDSIGLPVLLGLDDVNPSDCKELLELGVHCFLLGEDVTNPNRILNRL